MPISGSINIRGAYVTINEGWCIFLWLRKSDPSVLSVTTVMTASTTQRESAGPWREIKTQQTKCRQTSRWLGLVITPALAQLGIPCIYLHSPRVELSRENHGIELETSYPKRRKLQVWWYYLGCWPASSSKFPLPEQRSYKKICSGFSVFNFAQ